MSELQNQTIPILKPMIFGQEARLGPDEQHILSLWASVMITCSDHLNPRGPVIPPSDREEIYDNRTCPNLWQVWSVAYAGGGWQELAFAQSRGRLVDPSVTGPKRVTHKIHSTVFGMRHVVFLVIGTTWKAAPNAFRNLEQPGILRIWPPLPRSILWPPHRVLEDPQIDALNNVLTQSGVLNNSLNPGADWTFTIG